MIEQLTPRVRSRCRSTDDETANRVTARPLKHALEQAVDLMGPGLGDAERERKVFDEMKLYLAEGKPVAAALDAIYRELELEDVRQV